MSLAVLYESNGPIFSVLFLGLSLAAVGLIIWRVIKNFRARANLDQYLEQLERELQASGGKGVYDLCQREAVETEKVLPKVFFAALGQGRRGKVAARDAIADTIETEIMPSLQRFLPHILLIAKIAPMVGLLGTVVGMIQAFQAIASMSKPDPASLADDIGLALFTTAEGLIIAIPVIFAYTLLRERVNQFEQELQKGAHAALQFLPRVYDPRG